MDFLNFVHWAIIYIIIVGVFSLLGYGGRRRGRYRGVFYAMNRRNRYYDDNDDSYYERGLLANLFANLVKNKNRKNRRETALAKAKDFLRPYKNIFGKQILSNKFCTLTYKPDKNYPKFTVLSKELNPDGSYPYIEAYNPQNPDAFDDFFNSLCLNFSYNLKFFDIHAIFKDSKFIIKYVNCSEKSFKQQEEKIESKKYPYNTLEKIKDKEQKIIDRMDKEKKQKKQIREIDKININEASEAEVTALPGINIIQAKKIIKYRNLNGDFKSVDDFIKYSKVKSHFAEQLKERVTIIPKEIKINLEQSSDERIIDLD